MATLDNEKHLHDKKAKEIAKAIIYRINRKDYQDAIYWTGWLIQELVNLEESNKK